MIEGDKVNDTQKWRAVAESDKECDGKFFYAVRSTKIFCRPSCNSKPPLRENVEFFDTAEDAITAGYRPCKRCRPDLIHYKPALELAERVKDTIDNLFADKAALSQELVALGVSRRHMTEIFANQYGQTPNEYLNVRRLETAKMQLDDERCTILEIALSLGFESLSSFYAFFKKHAGVPPGDYRRRNATAAGGSFFTYDLAFGKISIAADGGGIVAVQFADHLETYGARQSNRTIDTAARQLDEYFSGRRKAFELPLAPAGTPFQQKVWAALQHIPYGETQSYKQVAGMIGNPNASRAVGMANNKNPLLVVIPCHRVVGADGSLVGYAASLETKKQLLELEQQTGGVII